MFLDIMFATRLLQMHIAQGKECEPASILATTEDENDSIFKWSHEATLLLIEEYIAFKKITLHRVK